MRKAASNRRPFEFKVDRLLPINRISDFDQLSGEYSFVSGFEEPGPISR
jgi:hypothetical protein